MRAKRVFLLPYLALFLVLVLSACSSAPALTPVPTAASVAPTVAGRQATLDARGLSMLEGPMVIRLSEFDTLTINVPVPASAPVELGPPASGHALSRPAQCPPPGNPTIFVAQDKGLDTMRAYLDGGGTVADLEKLLNSRLSIQNDYARGYRSARLFHTDVTGDAVPDVLVVSQAGFRYYPSTVRLFFLQCSDGRYNGEAVVSSEGRVFGESDLGILSIQDANDNGVPEITFTYQGVMTESKPRKYTHTLEWNGDQLVSFVNP